MDTIKGMLTGVVVGDGLGISTEFSRTTPVQTYTGYIPEDFVIHFRHRDRHIPSGITSDDSEMTLCLLNSILENQEYVRDDVLLRYMQWTHTKPPLGKNTR